MKPYLDELAKAIFAVCVITLLLWLAAQIIPQMVNGLMRILG